jgi:hypothetical protein
MNSPRVNDAIKTVSDRMMNWPRWYLRLRIWWHWHFGKRHWSTAILKEIGWFDQFRENK